MNLGDNVMEVRRTNIQIGVIFKEEIGITGFERGVVKMDVSDRSIVDLFALEVKRIL